MVEACMVVELVCMAEELACMVAELACRAFLTDLEVLKWDFKTLVNILSEQLTELYFNHHKLLPLLGILQFFSN